MRNNLEGVSQHDIADSWLWLGRNSIPPTLTFKHQASILLDGAFVAAEDVPVALEFGVAFEPDIANDPRKFSLPWACACHSRFPNKVRVAIGHSLLPSNALDLQNDRPHSRGKDKTHVPS